MRNFSKKLFLLVTSLYIGTSFLSLDALASNSTIGPFAPNVQNTDITQAEQIVEPYSDIIDWRYKSENGKMYRRQYNYSKQVWIGQWELC